MIIMKQTSKQATGMNAPFRENKIQNSSQPPETHLIGKTQVKTVVKYIFSLTRS